MRKEHWVMVIELQNAVRLHDDGKYDEALHQLLHILPQYPEDALLQYHIACCYDAMGQESKAIPYYEKAIELGLNREKQKYALINLGSTLRALGHYHQSKEIFEKGLNEFPNSDVMKIFYSMTLYNLKYHEQAMEILLKAVLRKSDCKEIQAYRRAIEFYSNKLGEVWD